MAKYRYLGTGPCRIGMSQVNHGDVVDSDTNPGRRFQLLEEPVQPKAFVARRRPEETPPAAAA